MEAMDLFQDSGTAENATTGDPAGSVPLVLSIEEAAHRLGVGRTLMYALVQSGAVESVKIGRLRRIPTDALADFVRSLRSKSSEVA